METGCCSQDSKIRMTVTRKETRSGFPAANEDTEEENSMRATKSKRLERTMRVKDVGMSMRKHLSPQQFSQQPSLPLLQGHRCCFYGGKRTEDSCCKRLSFPDRASTLISFHVSDSRSALYSCGDNLFEQDCNFVFLQVQSHGREQIQQMNSSMIRRIYITSMCVIDILSNVPKT